MLNIDHIPQDPAPSGDHPENIPPITESSGKSRRPLPGKGEESNKAFRKWRAIAIRLFDMELELQGLNNILAAFIEYEVLQRNTDDKDKLIDTLSDPYFFIAREVKRVMADIHDIGTAFEAIEPHYYEDISTASAESEVNNE